MLEGGPCSPCKERAAIRHQIKQLEEELAKLNAKLDTVGTMMNAIHDPFIHKLPPEVASHILRLSLPIMNNEERDQQAIHRESSNIQEEWTAPLKLGFVCRKWRQLTRATPGLWTTLYLAINPSLASSTVESLPGLLREWLHRSGALPLTVHFFHDIQDSLSSSDKHSNADDTRMIESLEAATCSVIDILNLHSSRWRSLNLQAAVDVLERFSSLAEPKQFVALDLTATTCRNIPQTLPNFMVESKLNLTHLKLTNFPLTSINIRWDNITHATFSDISTSEGLDFLRRATSLEFYCVFMYGSHDVSFVNPILHRRLRSFELSPGYRLERVLEAINLPSLEEWTIDVGLHRTTLLAMQALLKRSGCFLKVLNLRKLGTSSEDLHTLLQSIPSLERMRLTPMRVSADEFPLEILTQILWSDPNNSDISVGERYLCAPSTSHSSHRVCKARPISLGSHTEALSSGSSTGANAEGFHYSGEYN